MMNEKDIKDILMRAKPRNTPKAKKELPSISIKNERGFNFVFIGNTGVFLVVMLSLAIFFHMYL